MVMKQIAIFPMIVLALAVTVLAAGYRDIKASEAKSLLAANKKVFLLDVRTPEEFGQGRLQGAVLIPINEVERRIGEIPRNRPVVVYCAVGSRSGLVAGFLSRKGYREVYNMADGIVGWYRNGLPILR
ncbi:Rhodanese domain protein [Geobacter metallireducens RCH3]|uniref:Rhodanese homology domain superfamily protein n=1 Tax=Geobacter metallireducens (strain ATCC 53774 / DSM 7210 / GS-15) TaxID=269799 RepID=Q39QY8_GEOMG|nr:rhodanese-like domain-containing protein [Geobacter metallireducens]ABB33336.1 rhodanese homology domain superfamily protein [Geobacter metallireducens GS-15]EHP84727.1 Rhodanese domain protein [Geobacter metallireducens RCH3]